MKNKGLLIVYALFLILFVFAGCSSNKESGAKSEDTITISLWNNNDAGRTYYPKVIEEFENEYPDIDVELTNLTADTEDAVVQTAISDNSLPDIFNQNAFGIDELVDQDLIRDLNGIFPEEEQNKYIDGIFDDGQASYEGDVYLFPKYKGAIYTMYYNKNLLEKYGIKNIPKTWDELEEVGKKIYNESDGSSYGLILGAQSDWLLSDVSRLMATELSPETGLDYKNGEYKYSTDGYIETIKYFKNLLDEDVMSPTSLEVINEVALEYFANGEAAFLMDGNWTGQLLHDFGFDDWGVVKLPTKNKDGKQYGEIAVGSNDGLYVSKDTEHWDEVKTFLEYLQDNLYEEILKLGSPVVAKDINFEDVDIPFEQMKDISEIFNEVNVNVPDPLVVNQETNEVSLETTKNTPDTSPGLIMSGYLTNQIDDLKSELQKYEDGYNAAFDEALESTEDVSREDFQFPNWVPYENYTNEKYEELE